MSREEKISRLKDILSEINENDNAVCYLTSEDNELIESAIEALEQQSVDAISRKQALDVVSSFFEMDEYRHPYSQGKSIRWREIEKELKQLPSVQPKYNTSEWCHDCKEYDQEKHCCPRYNKVIRNAVEEIKQAKTGYCKDCKYFEYDHFENMGGIPLITAHKVCKRHGLICKTDEDGYCHLWKHKAESEVRE